MPGSGSAVVNFGAFPGTDVATVNVTGQTAIVTGSLVDAWLVANNTTDHSEDEHVMLKDIVEVSVKRSSIIAGTGFSIVAAVNDKSSMWGQFNLNWTWV